MTARTTTMIGLALLLGCTSGVGPDRERRIGVVAVDGLSESPLLAPDTVRAGVDFDVVVRTFGSSSCVRADGAHVRTSDGFAEITPLDSYLVQAEGASCSADLAEHPRRISLRFVSAGEAVVQVRGRRLTTPSDKHEIVTVAERITVE